MALTAVISPHLDDAVFSIGGWIATQSEQVCIVTVFAGKPAVGVPASHFDSAHASGAAAVEARRMEDLAACAELGAHCMWGPFLDAPYDGNDDEGEIGRWIHTVTNSIGATQLVRPLGIRHPQHELVARASAGVWWPKLSRVVYAELPYAALWPELMPAHDGEPIETEPVRADPEAVAAKKEAAAAMYVSQYPGTDHEALRAPEQLWRLNR